MPTPVKAAVVRERGAPVSVEQLELLPPGPGEVQVRLAASGGGHSDYSVVTGVMPMKLPCVLGHEGAGVVEEVGPGVDHVRPGDRVVLSWVTPCGSCFYCREGQPHLCDLGAKINLNHRMPDGSSRLRAAGE